MLFSYLTGIIPFSVFYAVHHGNPKRLLLEEDLRRLWKLPTRSQAERFLNDWVHKALSSGVIQLARFARKMRRHIAGILNYFYFPISTAKVEGINNHIKVIKRMAYEYRDLNYFMLKIYNLHTKKYGLS